jgi:cytochrome c biogenesis protein CcdA
VIDTGDQSALPKGWYADQQVSGLERYWTGLEWGSETREATVTTARSTAVSAFVPPRRDWIVYIALGLVLAIGGLAVGFTPTPDSVGGSPFSPFTYFEERVCASVFCERPEVRLPDASTATLPGLAVAAGVMSVLIGIVLYMRRK